MMLSLVVSLIGSLMYTPQEVSRITSERHTATVPQEHCLSCDGLIYQTDQTWSVWLSGQFFSSATSPSPQSPIHIQKLTSTEVTLTWHHEGVRHQFTLKPNQYYNAKTKKVMGIS
jgi:hypothetical protein